MAESISAQLRRIERNLNRVADQCEGDIMQTLFIQASMVASEQKSLCPVDPTSDTPGAARDSIRVEEGEHKGRKVVRILAGGKMTRKAITAGKAGFAYAYDYIRAIEWGTQFMDPESFFWPVWRARRKAVRAAVRLAVKAAVKKVWR